MPNEQHIRKWRLILGADQNDGTGFSLSGMDLQMDKTLSALYDSDRTAGLGPSSPNVSRWLGDIRTFFPNTVVQVMQQDALKRLKLPDEAALMAYKAHPTYAEATRHVRPLRELRLAADFPAKERVALRRTA